MSVKFTTGETSSIDYLAQNLIPFRGLIILKMKAQKCAPFERKLNSLKRRVIIEAFNMVISLRKLKENALIHFDRGVPY